ncbi:MAG: MFS transporter [Actinomycetota bacterium]
MRRRPPALWIFAGLSAALASGYGVLFTIVADYRETYGISETAIGWLIGVGFIAAFFSQTLVAPIADRGYARRVIVAGVAINIVGLVLMAFGENLTVLMIGRVVSGIGIGGSLPAIRRVVILTDSENLGANLGRLLSADVFGFAMGPAISAVLVGPYGLAAPFLVVSAATAVLLAISQTIHVEETVASSDTPQRLAIDLLANRVVAGAVVLAAGVFLMIGAFDALWDVVHEDLGTADWIANLGITLFAIPLIILGPTSGRLAQNYGPFRIGGAGLLAGAFFIFMYGQLPSGNWIFAFTMGHALTDALSISASGVAVAMAVPEERQAGAQGLIGAAQALAGGLTAGAIGTIYEMSGRETAYTVAAVAMVAFVFAGMWLAKDFWRSGRHRERQGGATVGGSGLSPAAGSPTRRPRLRRP